MFCQKCGSDLPAIAKFCAKCGTSITTSTPTAVSGSFCVNCGKPYEPTFKFCNYCGHALPAPQIQTPVIATPVSGPGETGDSDYARHYSQMSDRALSRLSEDVSQLRPEAHTALAAEMAKRKLAPGTTIQPVAQIIQATEAAPASAEPVSQPSTLTATTLSASRSDAPYAYFTLWYIASVALCSCGVFVIFHAIGAGTLGPIASASLTASLLLAFLTSVGVVNSWKKVVAAEFSVDDANLKKRRRRVIVKGAVLALLLFTALAVIGYTIGQNGVEAAQIVSDLAEVRTLGDRISKTRSPEGNPGIDWYVQMYPQIEADVERLDIVLHRLATEYPKYSAKFPEQNSSDQTLSDVNTGIRRMALLKQEIAVAKRMQFIEEKEQVVTWTTEMYPLLKEEDALDKSN